MTMIRFEGTCDVCGAEIAMEYEPSQGIVDFLVEDGRMVTWMRHYATAPPEADPNCAIYSSRVYEVEQP